MPNPSLSSSGTARKPYHGVTLVRFGNAARITLGCDCGEDIDCDCNFRNDDDGSDGLG
ncbi:MAG: hypothetical protein WD602_00460 [Actinomycetota bacterium]